MCVCRRTRVFVRRMVDKGNSSRDMTSLLYSAGPNGHASHSPELTPLHSTYALRCWIPTSCILSPTSRFPLAGNVRVQSTRSTNNERCLNVYVFSSVLSFVAIASGDVIGCFRRIGIVPSFQVGDDPIFEKVVNFWNSSIEITNCSPATSEWKRLDSAWYANDAGETERKFQ